MRVPPDQSSTRADAFCKADIDILLRSARLTLLSRVPKVKQWTRSRSLVIMHEMQEHARVGPSSRKCRTG